MGSISLTQLLVVAVIVVLLFGTKKLRNLGSDLGSAIKGFKKALNDDSQESNQTQNTQHDADFDIKNITESKKQPTDTNTDAKKAEQKNKDDQQV